MLGIWWNLHAEIPIVGLVSCNLIIVANPYAAQDTATMAHFPHDLPALNQMKGLRIMGKEVRWMK